jgi:hypothetical protein
MKNLHILMRTHSDYDEYEVDVVGITDQPLVAHAFLQIGGGYWSHEVEIVTLNVLQDYPDVQLAINEWLDPESNPLCECGHRFLRHRSTKHAGSCKHNVNHGDIKHKCKGFKLAKEQPGEV